MPIPADWTHTFTQFVSELKRRMERDDLFGDEYLGDNPFFHFILVDRVESWDAFLRWVDELGDHWIYRGQHDASWTFETSLDRGVVREEHTLTSDALWHINRKEAMRPLLYRFQQYAHAYLTHVPMMNDISSWYALMQHHCAPTPLLDWTESPFVAMYFAVEENVRQRQQTSVQTQDRFHSAVWAIDVDWLDTKALEVLEEKMIPVPTKDSTRAQIANHKNSLLKGLAAAPCVISIDPAMSNPRLFAQRGLFLCKLIDEATVAQLLMSMMIHPEPAIRPVIRKLEVNDRFRIDFLKRLRKMNIHRASLFPGLDGLGSSLRQELELKDTD